MNENRSFKPGERPHLTVAQVLGAHASAQIAAAEAADQARRLAEEIGELEPEPEGPPSFVETWRCESTVIGLFRPGH